MPTSPTMFRRVVSAFARLGLDARPLGQRFRNAMLRPVRAEMAARLDDAARTQWAVRDELGERIASSERALAALGRAAAERTETLERAFSERIGSLQQALDTAYADGVARAAYLARAERQAEARELAVDAQLRAAAEETDELHRRCWLLEQLLSGTASARPPGAQRAVARMTSPAVSVILPTYNRAAYVGEAIASVQMQSFKDWELIVVDDGSDDDTPAAVAPFVTDRRIRYVQQPNAGAAIARNNGIAQTSGALIAYIDSDNLWYPDFLSRAVDCLATEKEVDLVYGALVSDLHGLDRRVILWTQFDRDALLKGNFIDTSTIVHRRSLVSRYGGWLPDIERLTDWDLMLRYTAEKPARALNVLAACYRQCDDQRITDTTPAAPADVAVRRKWFPPSEPARRPRVLYVVWHYPQLSESYVETELRCMQGWGVHIELWRTAAGPSPYPTNVPIHDGTLAAAIEASRPDILHVHWLGIVYTQRADLVAAGLPVTVRPHGFDVTHETLAACLAYDWVSGVYGFPDQITRLGIEDGRLKPMAVGFDTRLFTPQPNKDRRLVVRTAAALESKDLETFFAAARRLPGYRFVLAAVTCHLREDYADHLRAVHEQSGSPAELLFDVPRTEVSKLVAQAGIYLHTMHRPDHSDGTPVGQPISVSEAMATGCYCLVRDVPDLAMMVEGAGATYSDLDQLVDVIEATQEWSDADWARAYYQAVEKAWRSHADVMVFRTLFDDWMQMSAPSEPEGGLA